MNINCMSINNLIQISKYCTIKLMNHFAKLILYFICTSLILSIPDFCFSNTIKIGMSLPLSGKYAEMGKMQNKGIRLWQNHVNENGGLLKQQVELCLEDDESSLDKAKSIYLNHIEKKKVDLIIGPYSSGISEAILPIIEKYRYPTLLSGASADKLWEKGYKYAFGVYTPASKYTVGFLQMLAKNRLKDIAIISADDTFSLTLAENTEKWARRFKLNIVYLKYFEKDKEVDYAEIGSVLKQLQPEAIVLCGHLNESVLMAKTLKRVKWYPKAYYASVGPAMKKYSDILGTDAELSFSSSQWEEKVGIKYPSGKKFINSFFRLYNEHPSYHAATAYGGGMILEEAILKAGSINHEVLRETLLHMDTMTLIGRYGVDKYGKQKRHFPLIIQWQKGKKEVVWPDEIKTSNPVFN